MLPSLGGAGEGVEEGVEEGVDEGVDEGGGTAPVAGLGILVMSDELASPITRDCGAIVDPIRVWACMSCFLCSFDHQ